MTDHISTYPFQLSRIFDKTKKKKQSKWSIVYIEGPQVIISKTDRFCLSKQCTDYMSLLALFAKVPPEL